MSPRSTRRRFLMQSMSWGLVGCGARLSDFPFDGGPPTEGEADDLVVHFHSVACFTLRWRDTTLLTDPFWTHLPFGRVAFGSIEPDVEAIRRLAPELATVRAVVVGHAHYDHCLGLPPAAPLLHPEAVIYGSPTLAHTFAPLDLPRPLEPISEAATPTRAVPWRTPPGHHLRILPIQSAHPDNIPGIHLFQRRLTEDRQKEPTHASDYQEGETLAFLVDFMDGDQIAHRVYIQSSSTGPPAGVFPEAIRDMRRVDLALLGMDCANTYLRDQPNILSLLQPRQTLFCHWSDFFRPKDKPPREIVKVDLPWAQRELAKRQGHMQFQIPGWDTWFRYPRYS